jgi:hypothetical protein
VKSGLYLVGKRELLNCFGQGAYTEDMSGITVGWMKMAKSRLKKFNWNLF